MKTSEMKSLTIGSVVANKLAEYEVTEIFYNEDNKIDMFLLVNDADTRKVKADTLRRAYNVVTIAEPVEMAICVPSMEEEPVVVESTVQEKVEKIVEIMTDENIPSMTNIVDVINQNNLTIKFNKDHMAVKKDGKNIMCIESRKKGIFISVRHTILSEQEMKIFNGKIVGAGTHVIDYRFMITSMNTFKTILKRAMFK